MTQAATLAYIVSAALFAYGLKMMGSPATARKGNLLSALGMLIAVTVTLMRAGLDYRWIALGVVIGSLIGAFAALRVKMTAMPEMVALFNGGGGLASMLLGWAEFNAHGNEIGPYVLIAVFLAILIGGVTFTGSVVAWGKLSGTISSGPVLYPGQQIVNGGMLVAALAVGAALCGSFVPGFLPPWVSTSTYVIASVGLSLVLGVLAVIPIGGADMPVVISLLNSYSGLAACAAGFAIGNSILVVAGSLVGASGIILTNIMCKAMNRSLANVLFSGFGSADSKGAASVQQGTAQSLSPQDAYYVLEAAESVVVVPGYGMAVAQAQHAVRELADILEEKGAEVSFAIHPVAGRMPGHMNVLLAEANVPYDKLVEMDDINESIESVDVCIVIGANDVVNPAAREDESSPIYGMPIIDAHKARNVFVLKRSMASGFAGIPNPLFFRENTRMVFGDAKATIEALVEEFKQ
jgi:NAD(P) transhydrogenase subunit beta